MSHTIIHKPDVEPITGYEKCDADCIARAVVAMLYPYGNQGQYSRLVWCGHHFADLQPAVVSKALAIHDSRAL